MDQIKTNVKKSSTVEESEAIESPQIVAGNTDTQTVDNTAAESTAESATNDEMEEEWKNLLQSIEHSLDSSFARCSVKMKSTTSDIHQSLDRIDKHC